MVSKIVARCREPQSTCPPRSQERAVLGEAGQLQDDRETGLSSSLLFSHFEVQDYLEDSLTPFCIFEIPPRLDVLTLWVDGSEERQMAASHV